MVKAWKFFKRFKCSSLDSRCSCCRRYDPLRDEHAQVVKLPNGESITIRGYEQSYLKSLLLVIMSCLTFLVGLVVVSTQPGGIYIWLYRRSTLNRATRVRLNNEVKIFPVETDENGRRWFTWKQHRFTWCQQSLRFKRVRTVDEIGLRLNDIHGLGSGLDPSNHQLRRDNYGGAETNISRPNLAWLLLASIAKPFRIYQVAAITVWFLNRYYIYAGLILLMVSIEIVWKIVLKYQHHLRLHHASRLAGQENVTVLSHGHERRRIRTDELVPGCVIELSLLHGDNFIVMPCDAVILSGSCLVFENGSSRPIHKYQLPRSKTEAYHLKTHRRHTLLRNSTVMLTNLEKVTALVLRTGWSTEHGAMLASKIVEEEDEYPTTFERHSDWLFVCLFLVGLAASLYAISTKMMMSSSLNSLRAIIPPALDFVSLCLPPLLPIALFITATYPLIRLYLNGFRYQSSTDPSVVLNRIGATDTVCLLENALLKYAEAHLLSVMSTRYPDWIQDPQLTLCLAACHSLTIRNGRLAGEADELKLFPHTAWRMLAVETGHFNLQPIVSGGEVFRVTRIYARENLTLVRVDPANPSYTAPWYFIKGHFKSVMDHAKDSPLDHPMTDHQSNLVVAFAGRPLTESERVSTREPDLSLLSRKFQLLGLAALELKPSAETREGVNELRSAGIRTLLISRRGVDESVQLARSAGLIIPKEPVARVDIPSTEEQAPPSLSVVDLPDIGIEDERNSAVERHAHVILLGDTLDALIQCFPELVDQIVSRVTVLASADAQQTDRFLQRLHQIDRSILICRQTEDHSPIAPIPCLTLTPDADGHKKLQRGPITTSSRSISSVGQLLRHSRASLVGSTGISKAMICYAIARLSSALLLYATSSQSPPAVQSILVDLALVMLPTVLYGSTQPSSGPLSTRIPPKSLLQGHEILSWAIQLVLIIAAQVFALVMAQHQPWFDSSQAITDSVSTDENYAVYSLSLFQYLTVFVVYSSGPPHRRRIWTNPAFSLCLLGLAAFCSVLILRPPSQLQAAMSLKLPPVFDFRLAIFSLAVVYLVASVSLQCLIDYCLHKSFSCRSRPKAQETALESLTSINVLYRPMSLSVRQPVHLNSTHSGSTLSLPIF